MNESGGWDPVHRSRIAGLHELPLAAGGSIRRQGMFGIETVARG
jgi:hypothetical protein